MMKSTDLRRFWWTSLLVLWLACPAVAQTEMEYGNRLGQRVGERVVYSAAGAGVLMDALDPTVMRWYMPQELFSEYGRRQWDYTNYGREYYLRYLSRFQEGAYYYDVYGNYITRGWMVYDWRQTQPRTAETTKITKISGRYDGWFQRLVISADAKGDYGYSVVIGDEIGATLTPMTFRKAGFNGVITSLEAGNYRATGLFSRITSPVLNTGFPVILENFTNLTAGRTEIKATNFLTLGAHYLNTHNGQGSQEGFKSNPFTGLLTAGQLSQRLELLVLRLSDDSPEDDEGGAILFGDDVEITTTLLRPQVVGDSVVVVKRDTVILGSSIGFRAGREGGKLKNGFLTADGPESITLRYVLVAEEGESEEGSLRMLLQQHLGLTLSEADDAVSAIKKMRFRLVLANDYRVEVASDRQTNPVGQPQFLVVARAPGNVKNQLNQREVVFDYGLPTANQIYGFTAEIRDFKGFDFYGELNINTQFRKYPTPGLKTHETIAGIVGDEHAVAWMVNLSKKTGPWSFFAEGFGMDDAYTTSVLPVNGSGRSDYSPEATDKLYDFVDDNDDNDRHPDQLRFNQGSLIPPPKGRYELKTEGVADPAVFPGYDENGDFIPDFNQNSNPERENFFPDYDEPFLRYYSDRPEFLFGLDLNNNGWVDRFENDDLPDYPYKKDHWGYNAYGAVQINPETKLTLGQLRQDMHDTNRKNHTTYGLFTFSRDFAGLGRIRVFDMVKKVEDDIPDDLVQWVIPRLEFGRAVETTGRNEAVEDLLAAEDTWINVFYTDWQYSSPRQWATLHRFKWETWRQRQTEKEYVRDAKGDIQLDADGNRLVAFDPLGPEGRNGRRDSGFLGLIDKVDYLQPLGLLTVYPKFKSEFLNEVPFSREQEKRRSWDGIFSLQMTFSILRNTRIELGWEQRYFYSLREDEDEMDAGDFTGDFRGRVLALQLTDRNEYQGYQLVTQLGLRYDRRSLEVVDDSRETEKAGLVFLSVFASLKE